MAKITYISHDGASHVVEAQSGHNLMETAVAEGVPGIYGDCGGVCACATCHVHVESSWLAVVGRAQPMEEEMLELTGDVRPNSRLGCQIVVSDEIDGLVVHIPENQGY